MVQKNIIIFLKKFFVIGITNRKDYLDEVLLRLGRIEAHVEIIHPHEKSFLRIFEIHTALMSENKIIEQNINLNLHA